MTPATLPVLDVPGLRLRRLRLDDAEAWAAYATLPEVMRHTSSSATSVAEVAAIIERGLEREPASPVHFAIVETAGGRLVAHVGFHTVSPLNRSAEVTYDVHPDRWGQGLARAACEAAVRWGFAERGWHRIQATTLESNLASQAVLRHCGFVLEGRLRAFRMVRGEPRDYLMFSRLPGDRPLEATQGAPVPPA